MCQRAPIRTLNLVQVVLEQTRPETPRLKENFVYEATHSIVNSIFTLSRCGWLQDFWSMIYSIENN